MGSADAAHQLLRYWISQHKSDFDPDATGSFEATLAHSIQNISTSPGVCSCNVLVTPRLQNNYGTLNGGCMAALACIVAGTALDTVSARSGVVASSSIDYMSAMPGNAVVEVLAKVSAGIPSCHFHVSSRMPGGIPAAQRCCTCAIKLTYYCLVHHNRSSKRNEQTHILLQSPTTLLLWMSRYKMPNPRGLLRRDVTQSKHLMAFAQKHHHTYTMQQQQHGLQCNDCSRVLKALHTRLKMSYLKIQTKSILRLLWQKPRAQLLHMLPVLQRLLKQLLRSYSMQQRLCCIQLLIQLQATPAKR